MKLIIFCSYSVVVVYTAHQCVYIYVYTLWVYNFCLDFVRLLDVYLIFYAFWIFYVILSAKL